MKSSIPGLIITAIILFNIFFLLVYFLLRFWKHDRRLDEADRESNDELGGYSESGKSSEEKTETR